MTDKYRNRKTYESKRKRHVSHLKELKRRLSQSKNFAIAIVKSTSLAHAFSGIEAWKRPMYIFQTVLHFGNVDKPVVEIRLKDFVNAVYVKRSI